MIGSFLLFIVYILSFTGAYRYIQKSHSKGGQWYGLKPEFEDLFLTFFPLYNSFIAVLYLIEIVNKNNCKEHKEKTYEKFFKIK